MVVRKDIANLSLKGKAISSETLTQITKGSILIVGENSLAVAKLDDNGRFEIYSLPNGKYKILLVAAGYETTIRQDIYILAGFPIDLEFSMTPKGSINNANLLFRLYAQKLQTFFIGTAFAETIYSCPSLVGDYEGYLGKHRNDVYETFASALACVAEDLCTKISSCKFLDSKWVLNIMNCAHDPWSAKVSPCWLMADAICDAQLKETKYVPKLSCFLSQLYCHWGDDLWDCFTRKYGWGSGDLKDVLVTIGKCMPAFVYHLFFE